MMQTITLTKYPSGAATRLVYPSISFSVWDSGMFYDMDTQSAWRCMRYTCEQTGRVYQVEAIAYTDGGTIHKYVFLNGEFSSYGTRIKHVQDNPLMNFCPSPEKAVLYGLAHAESVVKALAIFESVQ